MSALVIDALVTAAWYLPGESGADAILDRVASEGAEVPALWPFEVGNILIMAERRKRISQAEADRIRALLEALPIRVQPPPDPSVLQQSMDLARRYALSVYDASYLQLAIHLGASLATLDRPLREAARAAGVVVL